MSDMALYLVPRGPGVQPTHEVATDTAALLKLAIRDAGGIDVEFHDVIELSHPFESWDGARCPFCATDLEDWFYSSLGARELTSDPACLRATTPCCQRITSLNDLDFPGPCALGRFAVHALDPGAVPDDEQKDAIERCLGAKTTWVWQYG